MTAPPLRLVRTFVMVVECNSFARAAEELGMTGSSISRLIKALEHHLGVSLINRTTRAMSLTDAGQAYFRECRAGLALVQGAYERMRARSALPHGVLKISAPLAFARMHVTPHMSAFLQSYPQIQFDAIMTDRYVDIVAEGVALGIRIGKLEDSSLVARKLLHNRRILVAAPSYLARCGIPASIDDLAGHTCLVSSANHDGLIWRLFGEGVERSFRPAGRLRADTADTVHRFCVDGHGIAFHAAVTLAHSLERGELVQVLPGWTGRETGVYCIRPRQAPSLAARAFIDFLLARWRSCPLLCKYVQASA